MAHIIEAAKDLQDGKEVGRIGFYAPDIVIKGNMIDSITENRFLCPKGYGCAVEVVEKQATARSYRMSPRRLKTK